MNQDIENTTRDLLKKSLLNLPVEDFSNRVMEKIQLEARPKRTFFPSISLAWIFAILSIIIVPFGLDVITKNLHSVSILNIKSLFIDPASMSILLYIFFAVIILFILDGLIRLSFRKY
jgi:hypothetical protein